MARVEDQLLNILSNQQTIIQNQGALLTAVQNIPGVSTAAITTALAEIESQVADIDTQLQPTPSPAPAPTPTPSSGSGSGTAV